eukprot:scaffold89888_cov52-Attheya_sp.AAC.3
MMKGRGGGGFGRFANRKREAGADSLESPTTTPVVQDEMDMDIDTNDPVDHISFPSFQRPKTAEDQQQFSNIGMLETNSLASYDADVALQFGLDNFQAMEGVNDDTEAPEENESPEMMETVHNTSETPAFEGSIDTYVDGTAPSTMEVDQPNVPDSQDVEDSEMAGNNNIPDSQGDGGRIASENINNEVHTDSNVTDVTKSPVALSSDSLPSEGGDMESDRLTEIPTVEVHGSPPEPLPKSVKPYFLSRLRKQNPSQAQGVPEVQTTPRETNKHVANPEPHMGQDKTHEVKTPRSTEVEHPTRSASQITATVNPLVMQESAVADGINNGTSGNASNANPSGPKPSHEKEVQPEKVQYSIDRVGPSNNFEQVLPIVRATQATRPTYQKQGFVSPQKINMSTPQGGLNGSNLPPNPASRMAVTPEFPSTLQARVGRSIQPTHQACANNPVSKMRIVQNQNVTTNENRASGIASIMSKTSHQKQVCAPSKDQTANTVSTFSEAEFSSDTFDDLLSYFLTDLRDGMDIFDKGDIDLLEYQVELSQAHSMALRYRGEMMHLLDEISSVQSMADRSLDQFVGS